MELLWLGVSAYIAAKVLKEALWDSWVPYKQGRKS